MIKKKKTKPFLIHKPSHSLHSYYSISTWHKFHHAPPTPPHSLLPSLETPLLHHLHHPPSSRCLVFHLSHAVRSLPVGHTRFTYIRRRVNSSENSAYSPLNSGSNFNDRLPTEMPPLFPGCDYEQWLIVMDKPGGEEATKQEMIDCYIKTLAKVVSRYFGFGYEIHEETSNKLEGLPGVLFVLPDSFVDPEYKDYGAELFVNGKIVQRPRERQRRIEPHPQRAQE